MAPLDGKTVLLGITGGIAAYKAAELCRLLVKDGARVRVVMTEAACRFVTPLTMQALSGAPVATDLFDPGTEASIGHIQLADQADVAIVAPATADFIARMAAGMADDLLATVILATRAPILLAPAMNVNMWQHPQTQANLAHLVGSGRVSTVGPDRGELACGWVGEGRMIEAPEILAAARALLDGQGALAGLRVVVTAGPTYEPIDDVRFLGNRSSGKMGFALAGAASRRGAAVTLVAGPVALPTPAGVTRVDVETALQMQTALERAAADAHVVVMSAAVADFRPAAVVSGKLSRRELDGERTVPLPLVANPDLLATLGKRRAPGGPLLVGFAAEVGASGDELVRRARAKLAEKACDVIVANEVGRPGTGFGSDRNAVTLVLADGGVEALPPSSKLQLAETIWDRLQARIRNG